MSLWELVSQSARGRTVLYVPGQGDARVSATELLDRAEGTASEILARLDGLPPRRVGLLLGNGEPWVRAMLAVLRLDAAVVPLPLPAAFAGFEAYVRHLKRIVADADPDVIVVDRSLGPRTAARVGQALGHRHVLDVTMPVSAAPGPLPRPSAAGGDPAVIQYTSGSTSQPKGVVLSHDNVTASLATMVERVQWTERDVLGLWLPLYHDMGLFSLLTAFTGGGSAALWRPTDFIRRPMTWLAGFAAMRATVMPAPNFSYDHLVASAVRDGIPATLDLSSWRLAISGAEPVQLRTIEAFTRAFTPYRLPPDLFRPTYGMAEATLMVTFPEPGTAVRHVRADRDRLGPGDRVSFAGPAGSGQVPRTVVSCGRPVPGMALRVTSPASPCGAERSHAERVVQPEGTVGEIEIAGPAVTRGYRNLPPHEQPITADGWLSTGDLGFLLDGELYVTGRSKDMIIVRGQNYYAEDVEDIVRSTPGLDRRVCAALSRQDDGAERVVVLWETRLDRAAATAAAWQIEERVRDQIGLGAIQVVPVPPATIPHTTSGKVRRSAARQACGLATMPQPGEPAAGAGPARTEGVPG
jgi:acyl-CoA synthetase (AMP-forming)/AMP-acid ligase II